jgi:hypothetical protein
MKIENKKLWMMTIGNVCNELCFNKEQSSESITKINRVMSTID